MNLDDPHSQLDLLGERDEGADAPRVRVSARARRLSIRVYPDARVEVVVPPRARPRELARFVAAHRQWVDEKRAQALRRRPAAEPFPPPEIDLRATRERFRVQLSAGTGRLKLAEFGEEGATDRVLRIGGLAEPKALRRAMRGWLMRLASRRLAPRLAALASVAGVSYSRVSIRRQRSRWGSCSARGTISLNCCLLFQRTEVVDYLIVHELMHTRHMNHSARFWQAVERHCANWRALDRELVQGWRHVPRWIFSDE